MRRAVVSGRTALRRPPAGDRRHDRSRARGQIVLVTARRLPRGLRGLRRRLARQLAARVIRAVRPAVAARGAVRERARRALRIACAAFSRANARARAAAPITFGVSGAPHKKGRRREYANNMFHV